MIADYKLSSVKNGIGYFAFVVVEIEPFSEKSCVINAIGQQINRDSGEVNAETHSDWVSAAIEGAKDTLRHLESLANLNSYTVKITKVIGLETDTTEDAVRTAAALATWRAINPDSSEPKPVFDGHWSVAFPT